MHEDSFVTHMFGGFVAGTLVKTPDGSIPIEQLHEGDAVVSIVPDRSEHVVTITQIRSYLPDTVYQVVVDGESFVCDGQQKLYDPVAQAWIKAQDFHVEHVLCDSEGYDLPLLSVSKLFETNMVYELSVASPHTFLVGRSEVLVHNVVPVVFGISFAFGAGGITLEGITCAIAGIGLAAYNFFKGKQKIKVKPHIETFKISKNNAKEKDEGASEKGAKDSSDEKPRETGAQAPGKPIEVEDEGYEPPKGWNGRKVRVQGGPQKGATGWPDKKGRAWVPSGPNGHGGAHWDRQDIKTGNGHENIYPGGAKRGEGGQGDKR